MLVSQRCKVQHYSDGQVHEHKRWEANPLAGVKKTMINLGITKSHVSLADENDYAIAFAILEL